MTEKQNAEMVELERRILAGVIDRQPRDHIRKIFAALRAAAPPPAGATLGSGGAGGATETPAESSRGDEWIVPGFGGAYQPPSPHPSEKHFQPGWLLRDVERASKRAAELRDAAPPPAGADAVREAKPDSELADRILGTLYDYRDLEPEDGESWESWYYASFDLACMKIRELFGRPAVSLPAPQPQEKPTGDHHD